MTYAARPGRPSSQTYRQAAFALAGVVGPAAFTAAWIAASALQTGHSFAAIQISGLAAPDARDPWIMIAGFELLGGCAIGFGHGVRDLGLGARLIQAAGVLTIAAGILRRDHMLLTSGPVSWHNHAHDVIATLIYVDLVVAQAFLARGFGRDPAWRAWRPWLLASTALTAALLVVFAADTSAPDAGVVQRVLVSVPLVAITAIAVRRYRPPLPGGNPPVIMPSTLG